MNDVRNLLICQSTSSSRSIENPTLSLIAFYRDLSIYLLLMMAQLTVNTILYIILCGGRIFSERMSAWFSVDFEWIDCKFTEVPLYYGQERFVETKSKYWNVLNKICLWWYESMFDIVLVIIISPSFRVRLPRILIAMGESWSVSNLSKYQVQQKKFCVSSLLYFTKKSVCIFLNIHESLYQHLVRQKSLWDQMVINIGRVSSQHLKYKVGGRGRFWGKWEKKIPCKKSVIPPDLNIF
jgi:hypothetical protein